MLQVNQLAGFGGRINPLSLQFLGQLAWVAGAELNGNVDIGPADPKKEIFVINSVTFSADRTLSSPLVDGVGCTLFTTQFSSSDDRQVGCFVNLPTQSGVVNVDMNFSGTLGSGVMFVYKVLNRPGFGTNNTDADGNEGTGTQTALSGTTIQPNGLWLATGLENTTANVTWNNGALDGQQNTALGNRAWAASRIAPHILSTPSDVFSWSGSVLRSGASWAFI